jgi:uncharacterized glyoxalase superfamily protein PhnB
MTTETYPPVVPMIAYEDGARALQWLADAFGFHERTRMTGPDGRLTHGEMETEDGGIIMLATPTPDYHGPERHRQECAIAAKWSETPYIVDGILVYVADVDEHSTRARARGAHILSEVESDDHGKRYRAEDCEGHRWMFMERPGR